MASTNSLEALLAKFTACAAEMQRLGQAIVEFKAGEGIAGIKKTLRQRLKEPKSAERTAIITAYADLVLDLEDPGRYTVFTLVLDCSEEEISQIGLMALRHEMAEPTTELFSALRQFIVRASPAGLLSVLELLTDLPDDTVEEHVQAAVEIIRLLLEHTDAPVIYKAIQVATAYRSEDCVPAIAQLLGDQRGVMIRVSEDSDAMMAVKLGTVARNALETIQTAVEENAHLAQA